MFTTFFALSLFLALIRTVFAQSSFTIDTPTLVQCQATQLTWTDTNNGPYDILVVSADDMCGDPIEDLGNQTSTAMTWTVNLAAGTQVVLFIEDAACDEAWSGTVTVGNSSDTSCLAGTPSSAAPSATSTPAASGTPTVPSSSGSGATPVAPSSSPTSSAFAPAGAANAGLAPASGALSTRPLSAVTLLGSAVLAVVVFAL